MHCQQQSSKYMYTAFLHSANYENLNWKIIGICFSTYSRIRKASGESVDSKFDNWTKICVILNVFQYLQASKKNMYVYIHKIRHCVAVYCSWQNELYFLSYRNYNITEIERTLATDNVMVCSTVSSAIFNYIFSFLPSRHSNALATYKIIQSIETRWIP